PADQPADPAVPAVHRGAVQAANRGDEPERDPRLGPPAHVRSSLMPVLVRQTAQLLAFPGRGISLRAALTPALKYHRLPEQLIEAFLREADSFSDLGIDEALTRVLAARMAAAPLDLSQSTRIVLIGPSGAGRSTVAAKLVETAAEAGYNQVEV